MGTLLKAKCECGFEQEKINFGAVMEEEDMCSVPALRNYSSTIEMIDIRKKTNHSDYTFYSNKLFYEGNLEQYFNAWEFKLSKKNNFCPKCKKYGMEFIYLGEYD